MTYGKQVCCAGPFFHFIQTRFKVQKTWPLLLIFAFISFSHGYFIQQVINRVQFISSDIDSDEEVYMVISSESHFLFAEVVGIMGGSIQHKRSSSGQSIAMERHHDTGEQHSLPFKILQVLFALQKIWQVDFLQIWKDANTIFEVNHSQVGQQLYKYLTARKKLKVQYTFYWKALSQIGIMSRSDFLDFLSNVREPSCLSIMISLLGHVLNILNQEPSNAVHIDHLAMWPPTVDT